MARDIPAFIERLDAYPGKLQTKLGIKLLLLTFVRKQELVEATWDELDVAGAAWRIPAHRMKMRDPHIVPLSRQAPRWSRCMASRLDFGMPWITMD